mgnify:CR=1 FL=1
MLAAPTAPPAAVPPLPTALELPPHADGNTATCASSSARMRPAVSTAPHATAWHSRSQPTPNTSSASRARRSSLSAPKLPACEEPAMPAMPRPAAPAPMAPLPLILLLVPATGTAHVACAGWTRVSMTRNPCCACCRDMAVVNGLLTLCSPSSPPGPLPTPPRLPRKCANSPRAPGVKRPEATDAGSVLAVPWLEPGPAERLPDGAMPGGGSSRLLEGESGALPDKWLLTGDPLTTAMTPPPPTPLVLAPALSLPAAACSVALLVAAVPLAVPLLRTAATAAAAIATAAALLFMALAPKLLML